MYRIVVDGTTSVAYLRALTKAKTYSSVRAAAHTLVSYATSLWALSYIGVASCCCHQSRQPALEVSPKNKLLRCTRDTRAAAFSWQTYRLRMKWPSGSFQNRGGTHDTSYTWALSAGTIGDFFQTPTEPSRSTAESCVQGARTQNPGLSLQARRHIRRDPRT